MGLMGSGAKGLTGCSGEDESTRRSSHCSASDRIHEYCSVLNDLHTRYHLTLACLDKMGQAVMRELMEWVSLREVARRTNLSPTYLSVVRNGKQTVSPEAFVKLADLLREIEST